MGLRLRMKADYDCSGRSAEVQVLCTALKTEIRIPAHMSRRKWLVMTALEFSCDVAAYSLVVVEIV